MICMAKLLWRTAVIDALGCAIVIMTADIVGIHLVLVARWASPGAANAFLCATCGEVLRKTSLVDADMITITSIESLHISRRAYLLSAFSPEIAASLGVNLPTRPISTISGIDFVHVQFRARVGVAMTLCDAALMIIGFLTSCICTEELVRVMSVLVS